MALSTISSLKVLLGIALSDTTQDGLLQACLDAATVACQNWTNRPGLVSPPVTYDGIGNDPPPIYLDGTGMAEILLPHRPVVAPAPVIYEDLGGAYGTSPTAFASNTLLVEGVDYVLVRDSFDPAGALLSRSGIVKRLRSSNSFFPLGGAPYAPYGTLAGGVGGPRWALAPGSIKVVFTAGYPTGQVPADLQMAVNEVAAWIKRNGPQGGQEFFTGESLGAYSYSMGQLTTDQIPQIGGVSQVLAGYRDMPF